MEELLSCRLQQEEGNTLGLTVERRKSYQTEGVTKAASGRKPQEKQANLVGSS